MKNDIQQKPLDLHVADTNTATFKKQKPTGTREATVMQPLALSLRRLSSVLSYRSDLDRIPECEFRRLIAGRAPRIFNAYVNVASLRLHLRTLVLLYPHAKLIVTDDEGAAMACVTERLHKAGPGPFQSIGLSRYDG